MSLLTTENSHFKALAYKQLMKEGEILLVLHWKLKQFCTVLKKKHLSFLLIVGEKPWALFQRLKFSVFLHQNSIT